MTSNSEDTFQAALDTAVRSLGSFAKTTRELSDMLVKRGYSQDIAQLVVEKCLSYNYLDDEAYALAYYRDKVLCKGKSPRLVRSELLAKGIDIETVLQAEASLAEDEILQAAKDLVQSKLRRDYSDTGKRRALNMLQRRGHDLSLSFQVVNEVVAELSET